MTYATGRRYLDADSHLMELPGWLESYADPDVRDRIRPLALGGAGALAADAVADARSAAPTDPGGHAIDDADLMGKQGLARRRRVRRRPSGRAVLDRLGFDAPARVLDVRADAVPRRRRRPRVRRHPCAQPGHGRLLLPTTPVCSRSRSCPWGPPELVHRGRRRGDRRSDVAPCTCRASPRGAAGDRRHPDHDPMWATLAERDVPFVVHVGGAGRLVPREFHDNGMPVTDFLGGGENIRAKDYMAISHMPEVFLASLIFDGILERFPTLRGGCIEQGAMWLVPWLRRLDLAPGVVRSQRADAARPADATERVRAGPASSSRRSRASRSAGSPSRSATAMLCFSSDYPHPEGTRDPIGRFEATMTDLDDAQRERFYSGNFAALMGGALVG